MKQKCAKSFPFLVLRLWWKTVNYNDESNDNKYDDDCNHDDDGDNNESDDKNDDAGYKFIT